MLVALMVELIAKELPSGCRGQLFVKMHLAAEGNVQLHSNKELGQHFVEELQLPRNEGILIALLCPGLTSCPIPPSQPHLLICT
eukprot:3795932-Ditylum_brightwellii.AAC.1